MSITKAEILVELNKQFGMDFLDGIKTADPFWEKFAMKVNSNTTITDYGFLGQFPQMREWIGARQIENLSATSMSIKNKLFEATVSIPRTAMEDDNVGIYRNAITQMGKSAAELPNDLLVQTINSASTEHSYDGVPFFSDQHPLFEKADSTGTQTKQSNYFKEANADCVFYVLDTTNVLRPFIYQERTKAELETKFKPENSDKVFMEDLYIWGARSRGNSGLGIWQYAAKVESTTANIYENLKDAMQKMKNLQLDGGRFVDVKPNTILITPDLEYIFKEIKEAEKIDNKYNVLKNTFDYIVLQGLTKPAPKAK